MTAQDLVNAAKQAIGEDEKDSDYILNPTQHAQQFKSNAPELVAILESSNIQVIGSQFEEWDARANSSQKEFKKWAARARWSAFFTTLFSTCLTASAAWIALFSIGVNAAKVMIGIFSVGSTFFSVFTGVCIKRIRSGQLLERWMKHRAKAEQLRVKYFDHIIDAEPEAESSSAILLSLLKLEYFRRFQLDVEIRYYKDQGERHQKEANDALSISIWVMGGVAFVNALAGVFGMSAEPTWATIAVLALIAQAYAIMITNSEALYQYRRNAERYERTRAILVELKGRLDSVRNKIKKDDRKILASYVEAVHEPLSAEHRQWIESFDERMSAIGRLEQQLREKPGDINEEDSDSETEA